MAMRFTPRDVKDMVVQYPNRYRLTHLGGDLYEIAPEPGTVTEPGTPINRAYLQPIENFLGNLAQAGKWELLQEYKVAGTYTWVAPDLYGDGRSYYIGVCVIGGGGSGAVGREMSSSDRYYVQGGGSGYLVNRIIHVTPGQTYPIVVGAGGAAVELGTNYYINGNPGGSSSFAGIVAKGGQGGKAIQPKSGDYNYLGIVEGGQPASGITTSGIEYSSVTPAMGIIPYIPSSALTTSLRNMSLNCFNIFDGKRYLAAGGAAGTRYNEREDAVMLDDGNLSSAGAAGSNRNVIATGSISPGCGGGGAYLGTQSSSYTVRSAGGTDGAVMIYI